MKTNKSYPHSFACKRPKFNNNVKGATWDYCTIIDINGNSHDGWLDTTWGKFAYFQEEGRTSGQWRKVNMELFNETENVFDFRKLNVNV